MTRGFDGFTGLLAVCALVASCSGAAGGGDDNATLSASLRSGSGVGGFLFIIRCDNGYAGDQYVPLHEGRLADKTGAHAYADLFQSIPAPAKCTVAVTPMLDASTPAANCRQTIQAFDVTPGGTTEVAMLAQCDGDPAAGGELIPAINYPPAITADVTGKYGCPGNTTIADIVAKDPDGDAVDLSWALRFYDTGGGEITPPPEHLLEVAGMKWSLTPQREVAGRFELSVKATDDHKASRTVIVPIPVIACACCEYFDGGVLTYIPGTTLDDCTVTYAGQLVPDSLCK